MKLLRSRLTLREIGNIDKISVVEKETRGPVYREWPILCHMQGKEELVEGAVDRGTVIM